MKFIFLFGMIALFAYTGFAQSGGKAEPRRISFEKGKSSRTISGSLKDDEVYEFIFGASAGQKVKIKINSTVPKGKFHTFRVLGSDEIDFASDYDINYDLEFTAPVSGDYLIFVEMRPTEKVRKGKFLLTLSIN